MPVICEVLVQGMTYGGMHIALNGPHSKCCRDRQERSLRLPGMTPSVLVQSSYSRSSSMSGMDQNSNH